jgi:hypothetical protein
MEMIRREEKIYLVIYTTTMVRLVVNTTTKHQNTGLEKSGTHKTTQTLQQEHGYLHGELACLE